MNVLLVRERARAYLGEGLLLYRKWCFGIFKTVSVYLSGSRVLLLVDDQRYAKTILFI